jgi:hypothetical protein
MTTWRRSSCRADRLSQSNTLRIRNLRAFIIVELGGVDESAFEEVALSLLALNGRWLDTAGASFAMHPPSDRLVAVLPVAAAALGTETLPQIVDRFLT